jgi:hypothetical protein
MLVEKRLLGARTLVRLQAKTLTNPEQQQHPQNKAASITGPKSFLICVYSRSSAAELFGTFGAD